MITNIDDNTPKQKRVSPVLCLVTISSVLTSLLSSLFNIFVLYINIPSFLIVFMKVLICLASFVFMNDFTYIEYNYNKNYIYICVYIINYFVT